MESKVIKDLPLNVYYSDITNWSKEISGGHILTCAPENEKELLSAINWAYKNDFCARPLGMKHNWSPLTIANGNNNGNVLLIDLTKKIKKVEIIKEGENGYVTAQTGVSMQELLTLLEKNKLGLYSTPAPGDLTLGGVLAIGGHGTCIPAVGEESSEFGNYGSVSNCISAINAVVWNSEKSQYELREFKRDDPEISAFLVHVGRAFIYEVTLQVPRNRRLRCQSFVNIPAIELFSIDGTSQRTFSHYLDQCGRAEAIWFPFTKNPWLKIWTLEDKYPNVSKPTNGPFNYPFSDNLPVQISDIIKKINNGSPELTPQLGKVQMELVSIGLGATLSTDLWGWSKDLLLYVKPTTLRVTANGYAIITKRSNIQKVLNEFVEKYESMVGEYQKINSFPMNGPIEIRVTGVDRPQDNIVENAVVADLSASAPVEGKPDWDVAIWLDILTMPDTPDANKFYSEMEKWIYSHYSGDYATVRVEWSKGWGYTESSAWADEKFISQDLPKSFGAGSSTNDYWLHAHNTLLKYDPNYIFSSPLLDMIFEKKN
ncbi:cholesterol oxidase substrate-binding domain-containing protein [Serratia proteamaculans]|uniref:cholesterol oxidase substrate-binding domain-containing protein n=1 Tax=Serratia proteamaculans TaxID=28151 RepID=UPI00217ACA04|nr:cholesterol oxidase substrate-binding domain-containing protein [Serratia proteamaculans]CAI1979985.1 plant-specific FAD-dependent oxidoreductase [Serratia proteamaculans]